MPDILQQLLIAVPVERVFDAVSTPDGLDQWWTESARGTPAVGERYTLGFTAAYQWAAVVTVCEAPRRFVLRITEASEDWIGTEVEFLLRREGDATVLDFAHRGWADASDHFRISAHCWACYLRILRRALTHGESVPYALRLDV